MVAEIKPVRLWWVNQGSTFADERSAGYVFAPRFATNGQTVPHWETLLQLQRGDLILHYSNGFLRSLSQVIEPYRIAQRPIARPGFDSTRPGYLVLVAYCDTAAPIALDEIPIEWRLEPGGPFTRNGRVRQGYLFPLSEAFKRRFISTFKGRWPEMAALNGADKSADRRSATSRGRDGELVDIRSGTAVLDVSEPAPSLVPLQPTARKTRIWRPAGRTRRPAPSRRLPGIEQPPVAASHHGPASFQSWAASWYARVGARPESASYLAAISEWRRIWRPRRVRVLLVAESHVGEQVGDGGISVLPMRWINRRLPTSYVRLIYCLAYGETGICSSPPQPNPGTPQFWNIFGEIAFGQSPPPKRSSSLRERLQWKVAVLEELERRGIWLQDACPLGVYLGRGQRLDPQHYAQLLREGYERFVWPTVAEDDPEQVWVIGKGVYRAIAGLPGVRADLVISQPQDRNRDQHLDGLRRLRLACHA